jgi:hypothetical protein
MDLRRSLAVKSIQMGCIDGYRPFEAAFEHTAMAAAKQEGKWRYSSGSPARPIVRRLKVSWAKARVCLEFYTVYSPELHATQRFSPEPRFLPQSLCHSASPCHL